ncbi:MAG: phosphoribosylglycinamide formyltransferase [candidate division WOR-3 bacterium]|nr:phosphoribosylglycinamide formyltransferase [candidate division WOR-3 bacterium]
MAIKKNIAVLASGRGTNFEALARACQHPDFPAELKILVVNVPDAPVLARADNYGITTAVVDHRQFRKRKDFEAEVIRVLEPHGIDLVCLAGFNRILTGCFLERFPMRIMNIHPSLLPAFAGLQGLEVHRAVIEYGVKVTGCTVHFVTGDLDAGPIIVQRAIPVRDEDTPESLAVRVLVEEHQAYPLAVRLFCEDRLILAGRRVLVRAQ